LSAAEASERFGTAYCLLGQIQLSRVGGLLTTIQVWAQIRTGLWGARRASTITPFDHEESK